MVQAIKHVEQGDAARNEPWWVALIVRVGPVAVLALGLSYFLATSVNAGLEKSIESQRQILQRLEDHMHDIEVERQYLRALCLNGAAGEEEYRRCAAIEPR
jgi:hypothetical protein